MPGPYKPGPKFQLINQDSRFKMKVAGPFEDKAAIQKMASGAMTAN
jgi:hypothetical protein